MRENYASLKRCMLALALLIAAAIIIQSCKKDNGYPKETSLTVNELENWYKNNQLAIIPQNNAFADLKPDFATATQSIKDGMRVLEVDFDADNRLAIGENIGNDNQRAAIKARTQTKLILLNKIGTPEVMGAYMVLNGLGSEDLNKVHYKDFNGYSGTMMFFNLDGSFSNGYIIANGKITRTLAIAAKEREPLDVPDGLAGKVIRENTSNRERLMVADNSTFNCNIATYDVYQQHCFTFDVGPALGSPSKTLSLIKPGNKLMVSQTFCSWVLVGSIDIIDCTSTVGDTGGGGYYPTNSSGSNGSGSSSSSTTNKIITTDISITRNEKAKCALDKMLNQNRKFDSLLKAFTGKGYDLTFKVVDVMKNDSLSRGETIPSTSNPKHIFINLRKSFVNEAPPIHIAKTLLHEAFHANLMQRAYEVFGTYDVNTNWVKKPEEMALNELMDIFESKLNGTDRAGVHHQYIAKHVNDIVIGLKEFAQKNDENYATYNDNHFNALAYEGLFKTHYFRQNVQDTEVDYFGHSDNALKVYSNLIPIIISESKIKCGLPTIE